ncbi:MAG: VOC family protein [Luteolibacter sp.]
MSEFHHVPEGYHSVTPSLTSKSADASLKFYAAAFGAVEHFRLPDEKTGGVAHAEFEIGNSIMMISDEYPSFGSFAPEFAKGGSFMIYVTDCEASFAQSIAAGATALTPPTDQFWGDRTAMVADPFGYRWTVAQKVSSPTPEEMAEGMKKFCS